MNEVAIAAAAGSYAPSEVQALSVLAVMLIVVFVLGWKSRGLWLYGFLRRDLSLNRQRSKVSYPARQKIYGALGNEQLTSLCADVAAMERENYALTLMNVLREDGGLPNSPDGLEAVLVETRRRYEVEEKSRSSRNDQKGGG